MNVLTQHELILWLRLTNALMEEHKDELTRLDADIGDADHGLNMVRGFGKVVERLPKIAENDDLGRFFHQVGMSLVASIGGAAGPLYGTLFLAAAEPSLGKTELALSDLSDCLRVGTQGVQKRGGAQPGEKTMVDTLDAAYHSLARSVVAGKELKEGIELMVIQAQSAMLATRGMVARKGRASYLGERSLGFQDPGATSTYLILLALRDFREGD